MALLLFLLTTRLAFNDLRAESVAVIVLSILISASISCMIRVKQGIVQLQKFDSEFNGADLFDEAIQRHCAL